MVAELCWAYMRLSSITDTALQGVRVQKRRVPCYPNALSFISWRDAMQMNSVPRLFPASRLLTCANVPIKVSWAPAQGDFVQTTSMSCQ